MKAFQHVSSYDSAVAEYLLRTDAAETKSQFPDIFVPHYEKTLELRYGENPHQSAALYLYFILINAFFWVTVSLALKIYVDDSGFGIAHAQLLQGTPLSYNNILDGDAALRSIRGIYVAVYNSRANLLNELC